MPQVPQTVRYKQVRNDEPNMQEFMVCENLDAHLQRKGDEQQGRDRQKESSLQSTGKEHGQSNHQPFEPKRESQVLDDIPNGGIAQRVTPVKKRRGRRATAATAQINDLRQSQNSG